MTIGQPRQLTGALAVPGGGQDRRACLAETNERVIKVRGLHMLDRIAGGGDPAVHLNVLADDIADTL